MKCKTCGKNSESEYCFQHKSRKPLPSGKGFSRKVSVISIKKPKSVQNNNQLSDMNKFFMDIWKKSDKKSEVSGKFLGKEPSTAFFHHILPKSKYPEACFDEENIILLTLDEHANVESDIYKYELINNKRTYLLEKWKLKY